VPIGMVCADGETVFDDRRSLGEAAVQERPFSEAFREWRTKT